MLAQTLKTIFQVIFKLVLKVAFAALIHTLNLIAVFLVVRYSTACYDLTTEMVIVLYDSPYRMNDCQVYLFSLCLCRKDRKMALIQMETIEEAVGALVVRIFAWLLCKHCMAQPVTILCC